MRKEVFPESLVIEVNDAFKENLSPVFSFTTHSVFPNAATSASERTVGVLVAATG